MTEHQWWDRSCLRRLAEEASLRKLCSNQDRKNITFAYMCESWMMLQHVVLLWVTIKKNWKPLHGEDFNMAEKSEKRWGLAQTSPDRQGVSVLFSVLDQSM